MGALKVRAHEFVKNHVLNRSIEWKVLRFLGLSDYEARVYVSLITEGASRARKLSVRSGVPRTKVYAALKKLMERGLVFELPGRPLRFAPTSPAETFKTYIQHFKEETSGRIISLIESLEVISSMDEDYKKTQSTVKPRKEDLWVVQGRSGVLGKAKEMLVRAKKGVDVVTTGNGFVLFYKAVGKLLDKLVEGGVSFRIWAPINSYNGRLARELGYVCKVENVDIGSPLLFLCVDGREFLLAELVPDDLNVDSGEDFGVISQNPDVGRLISLLLPRSAREASQ